MIITRRTFGALKHAKGSPERAQLNLSSLTSEYMPSYKYVICEDSGQPTPYAYTTKGEAETMLDIKYPARKLGREAMPRTAWDEVV